MVHPVPAEPRGDLHVNLQNYSCTQPRGDASSVLHDNPVAPRTLPVYASVLAGAPGLLCIAFATFDGLSARPEQSKRLHNAPSSVHSGGSGPTSTGAQFANYP